MTNTPQRPSPPKSKAFTRPQPRPNNNQGGGNREGNNRPNDNSNPMPNPWLLAEKPPIDNSAGFTEYLRWMREADSPYKDGKKVEILQKIQDNCQHYHSRLTILNQRTLHMADIVFEAQSTWRIRVGGHRGVENILLPAFDALGMPYLPASSLKGVARNYAIREIIKNESLAWQEAEKKIAPYFGSINTDNKANQMGKIVFFDAYPKEGCLEMDMANNIWTWQDNNLKYAPNPNPFLSLKDATFVIGLRLASNCQNKAILEQVKSWLIKGLSEGVGAQVNSGYGQLTSKEDKEVSKSEFLRVGLAWEGQLIHGYQAFTRWNQNNHGNWQMRGQAKAEVRPIALKSMLRYWFRAFALGVLPANEVQEWEGRLFGSISPHQHRGYIQCNILEGDLVQREARNKNDEPGEQEGILTLSYSSETAVNQQANIKQLMENLTWMMINLGGIGQGSRRPCYSRENRQYAPWWRGSTFFVDSRDSFWKTGETVKEFHSKFKERLTTFYSALGQLTNKTINYRNPRNNGQVTREDWQEAIDINCKIIICSGAEDFNKPYALATLHSQELKRNNDYDGDLCGKVRGGVKPSPVWVTDGGNHQVVTVFGATQNPRQRFLQILKDNATQYHQIFPFN
ncbi:MAG: type III-B CRISPR module RAMP protein Cmr6 [Cyanobacterium sp. T60_A2020_053]|nr:type III-B CRISPR module RAMP protein Cmr6 [Cyanobacterium sp. T60_A2020_053]